jgi:hypothetical protein
LGRARATSRLTGVDTVPRHAARDEHFLTGVRLFAPVSMRHHSDGIDPIATLPA